MGAEINENIIFFEGTVHDINLHNSKVGDETWIDVKIRVAGQAGITAAMQLHKAKDKIVKVAFAKEQ